jgi:hypothetical protein
MPQKSAYETGARKYPARTGPDPSDAFSQDAAGNRPPASSAGLTGRADDPRKSQRKPGHEDASPEPDHSDPPPRDTREAPAPNPNGKPIKKDG